MVKLAVTLPLFLVLSFTPNFASGQEFKNITYDTISCEETTSKIPDETSAAKACADAVKEAYLLCETNGGRPVLGPAKPELSIDESEENKYQLCCLWGAGCVFQN